MTEKVPAKPEVAIVVPPRRHPGHRGQDARDAVAEMAAKAAEISMEAGSKMAAAMKEVINAAAGLTGFAIESARDVVQFMVRRGQMTQDEADKLLHGVEEAYSKRHKGAKPSMLASVPAAKAAAATHKPAAAAHAALAHKTAPKPASKKAAPAKKAPKAKKATPAKKAAAAKKAPAAKKAHPAKKVPAARKPAPKK